MFCPHCGTQLPDGNKFCTGCGASLAEAAEVVRETAAPQPEPVYAPPAQEFVPNYAQQTYAAAATAPAPKKKGKTGLIVGLSSAIVVIAALVCAFFFWIQPNFLSDEAKYDKAMEEAAEALDAGDYEAAVAAYKTALGFADGDEQKKEIYLARAEAYMDAEEYEDAIADYEAALEIDEDQKKVWALMADAYVALEDVEKAIETLNDGYAATEADSLLEKVGELTAPAGEDTPAPDTDTPGGNTPADPQPGTPTQPDAPATEDPSTDPGYDSNDDRISIGGYEFDLDETYIDLSYCGLTDADIGNLARFVELEQLNLSGNEITDLSPLAGLTSLCDLTIDYNPVESLEPLSGLTNLEWFSAESCELTSLDGLENCREMYRLYLYDNNITDISAIANMYALEKLTLWDNPVSDISPLANLTSLTYLDLDSTNVDDVTPLFGLVNLESLYLSGDYVDDSDWEMLYAVLPLYGGSGEISEPVEEGEYFDYSDLYIGVNSWSDFCHEDADGMLEGYAVDLGIEIADALGLTPEFYGITDKTQLMVMLESGEIDIYIDVLTADEAYELAAEFGMNVVLSDPFLTMDGEPYCIVTTGYYYNLDDMLNEAIAMLRETGFLDDIFDYWSEYDYSNW